MDIAAIEASVRYALCERLGVPPEHITPAASFKEDMKLDSLALIELLAELEERLGITIPNEAAFNMRTMGDVVRFIQGAGARPAPGA